VALTKFAACLGAAAFAWFALTPFVVAILLSLRSKALGEVSRTTRTLVGNFTVLDDELESDTPDLEQADLNGKILTHRFPVTPYSNLVDSSEMRPIRLSSLSTRG
jgi:hypothetical protein